MTNVLKNVREYLKRIKWLKFFFISSVALWPLGYLNAIYIDSQVHYWAAQAAAAPIFYYAFFVDLRRK